MLTAASFLANAVLLAAAGALALRLQRERAGRKQRGLFGPWPIRKVAPETFDARFATGPLGPDPATEVRFVATYRVAGGISDFETWILCNLAKDADEIFEFGTCTGKTTWLLAANAPGATVHTLTLRPEDTGAYRGGSGDDPAAVEAAMMESAFTDFFYIGRPEADRIRQLFGDSKNFDEGAYRGRMDLVFVDASHARSYVESDSRKALAMVRPGGLVLWHDYRGPRRAKGVFQALNRLAREIDLVHIDGTSLVAHRAPGA